jgi:hypothetical protein
MDKYSSLSSHLSRANSVASDALRRTIRRHERDASTGGGGDDDDPIALDANDGEGLVVNYLRIKNDVTISYLIDLALLLRHKLLHSSSRRRRPAATTTAEDGRTSTRTGGRLLRRQERECLGRLVEMKVVLERMRPLEKKMRYQIDKLLALSTLGGGTGMEAGTFASVGGGQTAMATTTDAKGDGGNVGNDVGSDPLSFRPDLRGMMKMFEGEEEKGGYGGVSDDGNERFSRRWHSVHDEYNILLTT